MCVAVGIGPAEVFALDADTFDVLEDEAARARRWSTELELLATQVELQSAALVAFLAANTKKGTKLPTPLRVPRPDADPVEADAKPRVGAAAFARMLSPVVQAVPTKGAA